MYQYVFGELSPTVEVVDPSGVCRGVELHRWPKGSDEDREGVVKIEVKGPPQLVYALEITKTTTKLSIFCGKARVKPRRNGFVAGDRSVTVFGSVNHSQIVTGDNNLVDGGNSDWGLKIAIWLPDRAFARYKGDAEISCY
jgi:hypothetical protein